MSADSLAFRLTPVQPAPGREARRVPGRAPRATSGSRSCTTPPTSAGEGGADLETELSLAGADVVLNAAVQARRRRAHPGQLRRPARRAGPGGVDEEHRRGRAHHDRRPQVHPVLSAGAIRATWPPPRTARTPRARSSRSRSATASCPSARGRARGSTSFPRSAAFFSRFKTEQNALAPVQAVQIYDGLLPAGARPRKSRATTRRRGRRRDRGDHGLPRGGRADLVLRRRPRRDRLRGHGGVGVHPQPAVRRRRVLPRGRHGRRVLHDRALVGDPARRSSPTCSTGVASDATHGRGGRADDRARVPRRCPSGPAGARDWPVVGGGDKFRSGYNPDEKAPYFVRGGARRSSRSPSGSRRSRTSPRACSSWAARWSRTARCT